MAEYSKQTDANGLAEFELAYGDYSVTVSYDDVTVTQNVAFRKNHKNFPIEAGHCDLTITAKQWHSTGNVMREVHINIIDKNGNSVFNGATGDDGTVTASNIPYGEYHIDCYKPVAYPQLPPKCEMDIVLNTGTENIIAVMNTDDIGFSITYENELYGGDVFGVIGNKPLENAYANDGNLNFDGMTSHNGNVDYSLYVPTEEENVFFGKQGTVTVTNEDRWFDIIFEDYSTSDVTLLVTDENGTPLSDVPCGICENLEGTPVTKQTDENGTATFENIPYTHLSYMAGANATENPTKIRIIPVNIDNATENFILALNDGNVTITVLDDTQTPVQNFYVSPFNDTPNGLYGGTLTMEDGWTDENGQVFGRYNCDDTYKLYDEDNEFLSEITIGDTREFTIVIPSHHNDDNPSEDLQEEEINPVRPLNP